MAIERVSRATAAGPIREQPPRPSERGAVSTGGEALPPDGNAVPPAAAPPVDISRAINALNQFLRDSQRSFLFRLDGSSGRTVITIVNPNTGEIVRQIPPEEVLNAARTLREAGVLLSTRA
jgi:flagellar protein FlaG